jgi:hypothetical protein
MKIIVQDNKSPRSANLAEETDCFVAKGAPSPPNPCGFRDDK